MEEQRDGVTKLLTRDRDQFAVKEAVLKTLNRLIALRVEVEKGPAAVNSDRFAQDLATILGDSPTLQGS